MIRSVVLVDRSGEPVIIDGDATCVTIVTEDTYARMTVSAAIDLATRLLAEGDSAYEVVRAIKDVATDVVLGKIDAYLYH